jgi:uncharacterized protein HemX
MEDDAANRLAGHRNDLASASVEPLKQEGMNQKTIKAIILVVLIVGIPVLVVMCVNNVSKESERRTGEQIAAEQSENQEAKESSRAARHDSSAGSPSMGRAEANRSHYG